MRYSEINKIPLWLDNLLDFYNFLVDFGKNHCFYVVLDEMLNAV